MKKTLIALLALGGIVSAYTDTEASTSFNLSGTNYASDYRLIMNGNTTDKDIDITATGETTIAAIDGNGLDKIDSVTFNVDNVLTITDYVKLSSKAGNSVVLNLGNTGSIVLSKAGAPFHSFTESALTLNAGLTAGVTERTLITSDYLKISSLTLNITAPTGYTSGGLVYEYNNSYYASSDVTMSNLGYCTIKEGAEAIELINGMVYTVADIRGNSSASIKGLSLLATAAVPEPTTATLSLLALAGLAARRRRK